ncbi:MAG: response regulator transcription factor [Fibrobacterales bacterium]
MPIQKRHILLIDDDTKLADLLTEYLGQFECEVDYSETPLNGISKIKHGSYDLVILDVMMPEMNGFDVCKEVRKFSEIPIILLTARGEVTDRVLGLELGADDYLPKPFEPRELVARIDTILRRSKNSSNSILFGDFSIDTHNRKLLKNGEEIETTTLEYELTLMFAQNPNKKFSRDEIMNHLQGVDTEVFSRSVDILVSRVRSKIETDTKQPRFIKTIWGTGYMFTGV